MVQVSVLLVREMVAMSLLVLFFLILYSLNPELQDLFLELKS